MRLPPPKPGPGSTAPREPAFMSGGPRPKKPIKPVMPGKPTSIRPGVTGVMPKPTPEDMKALAASREKLKGAVSRPKGMAYGGMVKKGMNMGGMANCGASMKPAQGKGK